MLTKWLEKKLNSNYIRMLQAILNKSWRQNSLKQQLYGHLPPIIKTIKIRQTRHAEHCWRSVDKLISDELLWTPSHGRAKTGQPAWTYIQQLYADTGCSPEDLPEAMDDREGWREWIRDIRADGVTWWWWLLFRETLAVIFLTYLLFLALKNTWVTGNVLSPWNIFLRTACILTSQINLHGFVGN